MDLENAYDKIYRYVYFKMQNQTVAEDITQETFLRFISQNGSIQGYEIKYLYTIARNLCVDEYRRVKPDALPEGYEETLASEDESFDERIAVRDAVAKLPAEDQEILLLRHVNNESVGTISKALGISRFALYRRLKSAEDKLRVSLEVDVHEK
jgi:RNA polymerase sigma-70 factor (ECF subfamily)